ncbi:LysR family transcriptional regulator [Inhella proteolytica]|uniref:LysR family transcriptional regulator n=1 Tax=Inhella proteolytica TaxID=2795029 RepID=A0A931J346_9BURK|nr:LysR family transcriptional regulator [Inhella proteolytica]MBH9578676.1 LysR family transcriptional regulator [Inhella proteolytica]
MKQSASARQTGADLPLHELTALEAVARLGSVQQAAEALHVTPSAISHRIASLERRAGEPLLQRAGRRVALTAAGRAHVDAIQAGLIAFAQATQQLREQEHQTIRIATAAAIGIDWLLPRLRDYLGERPQLSVDIRTVATSQSLPPTQWDLLIHFGDAPARGSQRIRLCEEHLVRVASATHAATPRELRLAQLEDVTRGRSPSHQPVPAGAQAVFDDALTMLEVAAAGGGMALTTRTAAAGLLRQGRLCEHGTPVRAAGDYVMDLSEAGQLKAAAKDLFRWLSSRRPVGG